ncbi:MAG: Rieske 2Fe-2S domain-containing protein [Rhodospirillales bacterium]
MTQPATVWPADDFSRVPYGLYHDADVYRQEHDRIFRGPTWCVLALEAELPKPGDFLVSHVGDIPVVVNRTAAGAIAAFVNRCAHRGAEIVRVPRGNAPDHTCIYHAWCYSQTGELLGVPFQRGANGKGGMPAGFDRKKHGLTTLRIAVWKGIVFGSFSPDAEPIEDYLGPLLVDHLGELFDKPVRIIGYQRQRVAANWKLYLENVRDGYHGSLLHEFNRTFGLSRLTQVAHSYMDVEHRHSVLFQFAGSDDTGAARGAYAQERVHQGNYLTLEDNDIVTFVPENPRGITTRIISVFPSAVFNQISNCLAMRRVRPIGPGEFEVVFTLFGYEDDDETMTAHRVNQCNMVGPSGLISMEDGEALELIQRSTAPDQDNAGVVEMGGTGPIVDLDTRVCENTIRGFWAYYSRLMGNAPAGAQR